MEEENKYISGETRTGFAFSILKKALKNWELAEAWPEDVNSMTVKQTDHIMELILGTKQWKDLCEHVRDEDNIIDTDSLALEITDIMTVIGEDKTGKN